MYDLFIKLFRDEAYSEKIQQIPYERIREYMEFMENSLKNMAVMGNSSKYFNDTINVIIGDVDRLARIRIAKKSLGAPAPTETYDMIVLLVIEKVIEFYTYYLAGFLATYNGRILVKTLDKTIYRGKIIGKNMIIYMEPRDALINYIYGKIEPVIKPYYREVIRELKEREFSIGT